MTPAPTTATERGSVGPVEDIVVDDQPVTQRRAPGRGDAGREPVAMTMRCACTHLRRAHLQGVVIDEARVAHQPLLGRPALHGVDHEADEAVAFAAHTRHHGAAIDRRRPGHDAEARRPATACAASAAAISSLLGMQPTRAQVVP
jgi:hypothetical protein